MWKINQKGEKEFMNGKEDWESALKEAQKCPAFKLDDEDELVADDLRSCYNCRFRRWTADSFTCHEDFHFN